MTGLPTALVANTSVVSMLEIVAVTKVPVSSSLVMGLLVAYVLVEVRGAVPAGDSSLEDAR